MKQTRHVGAMLLAAPLLWLCASVSWGASKSDLLDVGQRDWIEVSTPNFRVLSTMSSDAASEIALELERLRSVVIRFTNVRTTESPIPTLVFAFAKTSDFEVFTRESNLGGWFRATVRNNILALRPNREKRGSTTRFALHEYVHFLTNNGSTIEYPTWYSEGFAEYLSTVTVHGDVLVLGAVPKDRMDELRYVKWMHLRRIISGEGRAGLSRGKAALFYAEAWALVHYLHQGREGPHDLSAELSEYLSLLESGSAEKTAFEQAFGQSIAKTNNRVQKYLTRRGKLEVIAIPLSALEHAAPELQIRPLPLDEVMVELGQLALSKAMNVEAQIYFEAAIDANPTHARAHAGLGDAHKLQGDWDGTAAHFERSVELGPEDPLNHLDYAEFTHDQAIRAGSADERIALLKKARTQYVRSQKLDGSIPETYAMYGATYLPEGQAHAKSIKWIERANLMLPSSDQILFLLAMAYVRNDRIDDARTVIQRKLHWSHESDGIDEVLESIKRALEFEPASGPTPSDRPSTASEAGLQTKSAAISCREDAL